MPKQFTEAEVIDRIEAMRRRRPRFTDPHITMSHGSGGKASRQLVEGMIVPASTTLRLRRWAMPPWSPSKVAGWR